MFCQGDTVIWVDYNNNAQIGTFIQECWDEQQQIKRGRIVVNGQTICPPLARVGNISEEFATRIKEL